MFKKYFVISVILSTVSMISLTFAQGEMIRCPNLTANDVRSIINNGVISTEQGYTLADEAEQSRAQVLINEPTANPFDTYYYMTGKKNIDNKNYWIYIGNILGKASYEAKERAKIIFLSDETVFTAKYNQQSNVCKYKEIDASPSIVNYPFKSRYESAVILAIPYDEMPNFMTQMMIKKYRS